MLTKAKPQDFTGRFREIVADPLNLLIRRHPQAGVINGDHVTLHNGNRVHARGPLAYYDGFSDILVINRGVHEPLEELVFQDMLEHLPADPVMLELGAYWAHYSMWLKRTRPLADLHLVEPDATNANVGRANLALNGFDGHYSEAFVGAGAFQVDDWLEQNALARLNVLHCDIQGYEIEMLQGAARALGTKQVDYWFISTHSQAIHAQAMAILTDTGYRVEVSADFEHQTTSFDGFMLGVHPDLAPVFPGPAPLGRQEIATASPRVLIESVAARLG